LQLSNVLFELKVNILLTTKEPQPDAFEANNRRNNVQCTEHQQLQSQVLTALNTMNSTLSLWAWCSSQCVPY